MFAMHRGDLFHRVFAPPSNTPPSNAMAWAPTLVRDEMKYWLLKPSVSLQREIRCYFIVDAERRQSCKQELHLPDGYSELVFTFRQGFERAPLGRTQEAERMTRSYLIGARSQSIVTSDSGDVRVVGVKLEPRMLQRLIRVPLSELRDSTVELRDLNQPGLLELEDALAGCTSPRDVHAVLDRFFLSQLRMDAPTATFVDRLVERIRARRGAVTIAECARDSGVDSRTLERTFASRVGMTPKKYARIVRFKHAYHALLKHSASSGRARVNPDSYLDTYYDQSHFYKDFRFFTGTSPATLLASRTSASTAVTNHLLEGDLSVA